jgi:hypothetical protein
MELVVQKDQQHQIDVHLHYIQIMNQNGIVQIQKWVLMKQIITMNHQKHVKHVLNV